MATLLTFGKHKDELLDTCPESYIRWLATHKNVLSVEHCGTSVAAKELLEARAKKEAEIEAAQASFREGKIFDSILQEWVTPPSDNPIDPIAESKWGYAIERIAKDRDKALKRAECTDISNRGNLYSNQGFSILRR